jgi:hypothetical protein
VAFATTFSTAGSHSIEAVYNGNGNFAASSRTVTEQVTTASLSDAGFESPAVGTGTFGSFLYDPAGTPWTFVGSAGVAGNGSGFTAGNPNAPEGTQVGFLQGHGSFSQTVAGLPAGTYQLTFQAAQRGNFQASRQDFHVLVDGVVVGTFTPMGTGYSTLSTTFTVAAGSHTISFVGLDSAGGDNTAFIDNVHLTLVTPAGLSARGTTPETAPDRVATPNAPTSSEAIVVVKVPRRSGERGPSRPPLSQEVGGTPLQQLRSVAVATSQFSRRPGFPGRFTRNGG